MGRKILAVVGGYLAMAIFVMVTFGLGLTVLGTGFVFREGTLEASAGWNTIAVALSLVGSALGGVVAAKIGRSAGPVRALAGLVLALGVVMALLRPEYDAVAARQIVEAAGGVENVAFEDVAELVRQPVWFAWLLPFLSAAGVLAGGRAASVEPGRGE